MFKHAFLKNLNLKKNKEIIRHGSIGINCETYSTMGEEQIDSVNDDTDHYDLESETEEEDL